MKLKLTIATLLMSAFATAHAQSTVTIYGVVDAGLQSYNNGVDRYSRSSNSAWSTSRLGFRGSEDLGNGLSAEFMLEGQLNPSEGTLGGTTPATNEVFNREAWVGLRSKQLGAFRVGRTDVTFAQDIDIGTSQAGNFGLRPINNTSIELGIDQKNVVRYISPRVAGFTIEVGHATGNNAGATADAQASQTGAFVRYDQGKLRVMAGYQRNDATTVVGQRDFQAIGASYDFGMFSIGGTHGSGDTSTVGTSKSTADVVSVRVPLKNGYAVHAVYGQTKDGSQASQNKGTGYTLLGTKTLSKRTLIYAGYSKVDNQANSRMAMSTMTVPTAGGVNTQGYTVGINHTF